MKKIILVDGNNLLFRSFYATAYKGIIMRNSKGFPTNALYGFINMINKTIEEEKPEYILVAFDRGKTFRHDKYTDYKAGRAAMPEDLGLQFPKAKEVLDAMGIKHFDIDNYEADDIIGTLARIVDEEDKFVATIVSSDKDLLQLISDEVTVKLLKTSGYIMMDKNEFKATYKTDPIKMIDLKALMGDASDNIPGVKGIGEKTAINLIEKYESLDGVYKHLDDISSKLREKLINDKENAYMSYDIATIYKEVPLDFTLEDCKYKGFNSNKFKSILEELEFNSLIRKINFENTDIPMNENKEDKIIIDDIENLKDRDFSFYLETRGSIYSKSEILGVGIYDGEKGYFIKKDSLKKYANVFSSNISKYTYDLKKNIVVLNRLDIKISNCLYDAMIGMYLLDYTVKDDISFVSRSFNYDLPLYEDVYGTDKRPIQVDDNTLKDICCKKAKFIYETRQRVLKELKDNEEDELFNNIEMPLTWVLADMELTGIKVDKEYLKEIENNLKIKMKDLEQDIYKDAGCEFNIMSPSQLSKVLFEDLEIKYPKRVKDNKYSTSKDILDKIIYAHPIVSKILEYRTLAKLYTNYAVGLQEEVREDGRIHTIFTQTLTRTGRLGEENLIKAFNEGKDIHAKTASEIFHVPIDEVTKDMRRKAKAVNFGILYGISSFGLSEDLGIDIKEAKEFIDNYLKTFPGIQEYMEKEKEEAYKNKRLC